MQPAPVLAHPLLEPGGLPVPPLVLAAVGVLLVLAVMLLPRPEPAPAPALTQPRLGWPAIIGRAIGTTVLLGAIAAGYIGRNVVTENIAPVLVFGVGWPLLVAAAAALGRVWDQVDPWDTLARAGAPLTGDPASDDPGAGESAEAVWWAVPGASALVWYLGAHGEALLPRSVATALASYTIITLAGCLALGRRQWLLRAEIVGVLLGWIGLIRRRRLLGWSPPAGAHIVLGVLAGGLLFGMLRYSRLLNPLIFSIPQVPAQTVGVAVFAAAGAAVMWAADRACRRAGAGGAAAAAVVPMIAGLVIAGAMVRGQLVLALQLLPAVASDPLGRGWDLFGTADLPISTNPLGDPLHFGLQVLVLVGAGAAGGVIARDRAVLQTASSQAARQATSVTAWLVSLLVGGGILAVTAV